MQVQVDKGDIFPHFIPTSMQLVDIFTKSLDEDQFCFIQSKLEMIDHIAWIEGE